MSDHQNKQVIQSAKKEDRLTVAEQRNDMLQTALRMRLNGARYGIISQLLKNAGFQAEYITVRNWFCEGGELHDSYLSLKKVKLEELNKALEEANSNLTEGAMDGIATLRELLLRGDISAEQKISIAQDLLDRTGFPKTSKIEGKHDVDVHESKKFTDAIVDIAQSVKT